MWPNKYLHASFEIKGRGPDHFDCWGLLQYVYAHDHPQKIALPSYDEFYTDTNDRDVISSLIFEQKAARWREVDTPQEFDAVLLNMRGVPMHVGIVSHKAGHMLHCGRGINTSHEKYTSMRWANKVMGFYRYE